MGSRTSYTRFAIMSPRRPVLRAATALALTLFLGCSEAPTGPTFTGETLPVSRVVRELAFEEQLLEVVTHPPGLSPGPRVITPSTDYRVEGGDATSLVMAPPTTLRFTVPGDAGEDTLWLSGKSGVDLSAARKLPPEVRHIDVLFEVLVDGEPAWSRVHRVFPDIKKGAGRAWQALTPLELTPGQVVTLRTTLQPGEQAGELPPLVAGFGDLRLEHHETKPLVAASERSPNIVLIVMDTLRQDRLGCYGHDRATSPRLDALAERGVLYENAYSTASWTWPSTASILTGLHPETHGVLDSNACYLNGAVESLPELLSERYMVTAAFTCNPLIVPDKNFDQGFDEFDSMHRFRESSKVVPAVRQWIRDNAAARFFLYVQLTDPHEQYHLVPGAVERVGGERPADYPDKGLLAYHPRLLRGQGHDDEGNPIADEALGPEVVEWMQRAYDAAVFTADTWVGEILDQLEESGLADRTLIAFTSDHGEELLDHGLVTHGNTVFAELTRVPLILAGPGLPEGLRVEKPISNRHLAPSLAAAANAGFTLEQDPRNLLLPDSLEESPTYFSTRKGWWNGKHPLDIYGMREGAWELHWAPQGAPWGVEIPPRNGDLRLFDVEQDPAQHHDVAALHPDLVASLLERLREHVGNAIERRPARTLGAGERSLQELAGIGYIQAGDQE